MKYSARSARVVLLVLGASVLLLAPLVIAAFMDGGFETGTPGQAPPTPWTVDTFLNPGTTLQSPQTLQGLNLSTGGVPLTDILGSAAGPSSQPDAVLGTSA